MGTLQDSMTDFRKQLQKGSIQQAYRGLMEYMMGLRTRFAKDYPQYDVSGGLYPGYMDMTYFSIFPPALKARKLKIALVFRYDHFSFEVWLSGANRGALANTGSGSLRAAGTNTAWWTKPKTRTRCWSTCWPPTRTSTTPRR